MLALCEEEGLASINRSPLAMGLLTGKFTASSRLPADDVRGDAPEWMKYFRDGRPADEWLEKLAAVREILTASDRSPGTGALCWILARSRRTIPIPGFRTVEQVEQNCAALRHAPLTDVELHEVDRLLGRGRMTRVVVTGGAGKAGRAVVRELLEHGYDVLSADLVRSPGLAEERQVQADLTDLGETVEVLRGAQAVVHLAAIPAPGLRPDELTFRVNTSSTYNVFSAAATLGLTRVVWASSETVLGLPFEREQPAYAPIDEEHPPLPEFSYALSKLISEELARQFSRWTGIPFVGLRFSNIMEPHDYERFPGFWQDARERRWNLWGYVDARDVAQSCRLGLEAAIAGAEVFIVAAADTVMNRPSAELMAEVYPDVPLRGGVGEYETLLSIDKARRVLGYEPRFSWRDALKT